MSKVNKAIVLAGGLGTRLKSVVKDLPKPMAPVRGKPFLEYVLQYLKTQGVEELILSVGFKGQLIRDYFGSSYQSMSIDYVQEEEPLGTGGAIQKAATHCGSDPFFVLNGDSYFDADLKELARTFFEGKADIALSLKKLEHFDRYGLVELRGNQIVRFHEKKYADSGLINGGIYLMTASVFENFNFPSKFSFEKDVLEAKIKQLKILGCPLEGYFIDIGIPEDYERAQKELSTGWQLDNNWSLFLDRDGVLNTRLPGAYVTSWQDFEFLPGVLASLATLTKRFVRIVVVTNQQGVGKGLFTEADLKEIHLLMQDHIEAAGGRIDRVYSCTELASLDPKCRKPNSGMAMEAKRDFPEIDFSKCIIVGDSISDIEFGQRLGMKTVLVETKEEEIAQSRHIQVDFRCKSLEEFVNFLKDELSWNYQIGHESK